MRRLFGVSGMACGGCARGLERKIGRLEGVRAVGVHHLTASMLVDWEEARLSICDIAAAVSHAGYRLIDRHRPEELSAILSADISRLSLRLAVAVMSGMWSMALAVVLYVSVLDPDVGWWIALASGVLALPVVAWAGAGIFWMALRSIRLRAPGMDLLIALGAGGAYLLSVLSLASGSSHVYFDTATMLITLLLVGRLVDLLTRRSAIDALKALEETSVETVVRRTSAGDEKVPGTQIGIGDCVVIDAGSIIGVDGTIQQGESLINRAVLTGESRAIPVGIGQRVEAGSINLQRRILVTVDRAYGDRDLDRMGGAIALELAQRGTTASRADRMAGALSWGIPGLALATLAAAPIAGVAAADAVLRGLTVLAAACPCALSIAVPLAQARAAGIAAKLGLRLRDPVAFEALARPATIVFDKTGTLTAGRPSVVTVEPASGWAGDEVLRLAARAETGIDHPLAHAIIAGHGREEGRGGTRHERGAEADDAEGRRISVHGAERDDGLTTLAVRLDGIVIGTIGLTDAAAAEAHSTVARLQKAGIALWIASGDAADPTLRVAGALGIPPGRVRHGCTPIEKAELVKAQPGPVLFVGDGVNDAPALAAADCGMSVSGAHSAAAQTAGVVIIHGGIGQILLAIDLARRTVAITRQNLGLAIVYNLVAVPFAMTGLLSPSMAALAMLASSSSVALNSLRLAGLPASASSERGRYKFDDLGEAAIR
ncbi:MULTISPECIES: heavy metal translocating P-type ATPase [Xanthobacteraceae]|uniref:heavy metal translocating P-type ATPase n=1 Tax=Xanthobacteraceae TaxID=335928 RepID=UPI002ACA6C72|nr:cation-translocating P-type ATPase [Labrys sp. ZIDIC5]MDZ5451449.1 cation-translocating P-type ATPase [Labrys sp. ZIDIC5]